MAHEEGPAGYGDAAADHDPHLAMGTTSEAGQAFLQGLLQRIGMQPGALAGGGNNVMPPAEAAVVERLAVADTGEGLAQDPHAAVPPHDPLQIIHAALSQHVHAVGIAGLPPLPSLNHHMDSDIAAILAAVQEQAAGRAAAAPPPARPTRAAPTSSDNGGGNGEDSSSYLAQPGPPTAHAREKNRQAQRRFRERQKGMIAQLQTQVEDLHMQLAARNLEVQRLEQENSLLRARLGLESAQSVLAQAAAAGARFPLQEAAAAVARELEQQQQQQQQQPQQPYHLPPLHLHQPPQQQLGPG